MTKSLSVKAVLIINGYQLKISLRLVITARNAGITSSQQRLAVLTATRLIS